MSHADPNANSVKHLFRPASYFGSPEDVLNDATLSTGEKRVILSSWASDMYVVESHPALREVPGIPYRLHLDDILAALKQLDNENDPPSRGDKAMRLPRFSKIACTASDKPQLSVDGHAATRRHRSMQVSHTESIAMDARGKCAAISQDPEHATD